MVERELDSGGQGTVFLARDETLKCPLAIKILRPELASAAATERFQREARILASLRHPNIVPIHTAGVADGIPYYTMDHLAGETLATRLRRGPLPVDEVMRLGRDILAALAAAHHRDIVHRDVKPQNIFLEDSRGILVDFGVAKSLRDETAALTKGGLIGTRAYMAPEQIMGGEVTPRTDLYALGAVLYQALSGRQWDALELPNRGTWKGIPRFLRVTLRRALAWSPSKRWKDAEAFAHALAHPRGVVTLPRTIAAGAMVGAATLGIWLTWRAWHHPAADLRVESFDVQDAGAARPLGDSLSAQVARRLQGFPDFSVLGPQEDGRARNVVSGAIVARGSRAQVTLRLQKHELFTLPVAPDRWREAADELADSLLAQLFRGSVLDIGVPVNVLPATPRAFKAFLDAEKQLAAGHWAEADSAYSRAIAIDSACWLCIWRHAESARWVGMTDDTASQRFLLAHIAQFPPWYQTLIRVDTLATLARLDTLDALTHHSRRFPLGWFRFADERLHRGPLVGFSRRAADGPLRETLRLRPDFVPALEHLAWLLVAEGDTGATALVDRLERLPPARRSPGGFAELVEAAWAWRNEPAGTAERLTESVVKGGREIGIENLDAGARYLNAFDAPRGALFLGRYLEPEYRYSGRIAQTVAWLELGHPDSAMAVLRRELRDAPTPELTLFRTELAAALLMFSVAPVPPADSGWDVTAAELQALATQTNQPSWLRGRAVWMADLLACHAGPAHSLRLPMIDAPGSDTLRILSAACLVAAGGRPDSALVLTQPLEGLRAGQVGGDPFLRTMVHLHRSAWRERGLDTSLAVRELTWFENSDQDNLPILEPQPMEVDWAFGVLARWRAAKLLPSGFRSSDDLCRLYGAVARLWRDGEPAYAVRADTARQQLATHGCAGRER
jgi:hypothetical protein